MAERNQKDAGLQDGIATMNARLEHLSGQLSTQSDHASKNLAAEMRALSSAVLKLADDAKKS